MEIGTWSSLPWHTVTNREELIDMRARQLQLHETEIREATLRARRLREQNREAFNDNNVLRDPPLLVNDPVLLHDTIRDAEMTSGDKLRMRWMGPFRIAEVRDSGSYRIKEFDGTWARESIAGNRLKRLFFREGEKASWDDAGESATVPPMSQQRMRGTTRSGESRIAGRGRTRGRVRGRRGRFE